MQRRLVATVLIILWGAGCAAIDKAPTDARLEEAQQVFDESVRLRDAGRYAEAVPLAERALQLRETVLGGAHPQVASSLDLLGSTQRRLGDFARAEPLLQRALVIREQALGRDHPAVAETLNNLAAVSYDQGRYPQSEALLQRALAIREAALGKHHPDVAGTLRGLALLYQTQGEYAQSEAFYLRALAILEAAHGPNHVEVASVLNNFANLYAHQSDFARAEPLQERALAIREAALGSSHADVAASLNNLANILEARGLLVRAEPLYERALAIWEKALGENHPHVAVALDNLSYIHHAHGDHAQAARLAERALSIREGVLGKSHPEIAISLDNLTSIYGAQWDDARAEEASVRALAIREAAFGPDHPDVAHSLDALASLYEDQERYARAEPLRERALAVRRAALGEDNVATALSLNNLANLYDEQGLHSRAEPLFKQALAIWEPSLGEGHRYVATARLNLAGVLVAQQRLAEALPLYESAFKGAEELLRPEFLSFSESRLGSFLDLFRVQEEHFYAIARRHPGDARVRHLALSAALLRKGRSVEELANVSRIISRGLAPADRDTFERLRSLRTEFSNLSLSGPGPLSPADYQLSLKQLASQGNALQAELARRSVPLRALSSLPPPEEIVQRVAQALPKEGALVEFVAYRDDLVIPKPGTQASQLPKPLRYLALLLFEDGRTQAVDLGPAEPIDKAALRLHQELADRASGYRSAAQALYQLVFRPLVPHLGKVQRLFLSPDGQLALVPFAALHDGRRFLVEAMDISYLTSGKDLLPPPGGVPPARSVVVLADPEFDLPPATPAVAAQAASSPEGRALSLERFFSSLRSDPIDRPWPPLPGARKEAELIHRLLPQARLLVGSAATKHALLTLETPGILHIATHGFFLEDAAASATTRAVGSFGAAGETGPRRPADPLLRSGLVLAGARAQQGPPGWLPREDSLVTALELAGLDLWGTQLVVLSACDTGRGDVRLGQGVYGLRRALVVAGAESQVTSLWKVDDEVTRQLMELYYQHLLAGEDRSAALRQAMRTLRQTHPHPHFWASFIPIGRVGPLQGLEPQGRPGP